ncbi:MAG: TlpA disulfide reductase family protein [Polyangia bacterium]
MSFCKWTIPLAVMMVVAASLAGCKTVFSATGTSGSSTARDEPSSGGEISDFALDDVNGRTHTLGEHLGERVILLSFWATWCEPCKKEMVELQRLHEAHSDDGLTIFSISMDEPETRGDARTFVKQRRFTYPVLLDEESRVTAQFNPRRAAPYSLLIGRDQRIVWTHEGYVPGDEEKLERAVLDALAAGGKE